MAIWGRGPKANRGRALRFLRGVTSRYENSQDPAELLADKTLAWVRDATDLVMRTEWDLPLASAQVDAELAAEIGKYFWCRHIAGADDVDRLLALEFLGLANRGQVQWEASSPSLHRGPPADIPNRPGVPTAGELLTRFGLSDPADVPGPGDASSLDQWRAMIAGQLLPHAAEYGVDTAAAGVVQRLRLHYDAIEPGRASDIARGVAVLVAEDRSDPRLALNLAESLLYEAATVAPDAARRSALAADIGQILCGRFELDGDVVDLEGAIEAGRTAEVLAEDDPKLRAAALNVIGTALLARGGLRSSAGDLQDSVAALTAACETAPADDPTRPAYLDNLNVALREHAVSTDDPAQLDAAAEAGNAAVRSSSTEYEAGALANLSATLISRLDRVGNLNDLDGAHDAAVRAVDAGPNAKRLRQLGRVLVRRYEWRHDPDDLDSAVTAYHQALDLLAEEDPLHADVASDLGIAFQHRFARFGERADLYNATYFGAMAIEPSHDGGTARARRLANYGLALGRSLQQAGDDRLADDSIKIARQAADAVPVGHPDRPRYLFNYVATYLRARRVPGGTELSQVINAAAEAVDGIEPGHTGRARYLSLFATSLLARYQETTDPDDLANAGRACLEALTTASADDPLRYEYLVGMANVRVHEYGDTRDREAAREAIALSREVVADSTAPTIVRARSGKIWGEVAADLDNWATALEGFSAAVDLLPQLVWRGLEHRQRRRLLAELAGLPSEAASVALIMDRPERAIELLETGRGVLLSRHDESDPELTDLHHQLNGLMDRMDYWVGAHRRELARRWDELTAQERGAGPLPYGTLREAAADGPVVLVNVSRYRCDALIVTASGPTVVPLPTTSLTDIAQHAQEFAAAVAEPRRLRSRVVVQQTCDWLWTTIAEPVLAALEPQARPRVWWCPTGPLMSLPLHAAGAVPDRVISSYTPTLAALIAARRQPARHWRSAVLVGMPQTPGLPALPHAEHEIEVVSRRLPGSEVLTGPAATVDDVMRDLLSADVVHFACHGKQDPHVPGDGKLILADGELTLVDLVNSAASPQFAFLSACETARGDVGVPDESLHLAGALFLGGCPQVIGTIWPVSDATSVDLVADVYDAVQATDAASALHSAVEPLRRRYPDDPMRWASHVHFGP